jgi:hypothetical protein
MKSKLFFGVLTVCCAFVAPEVAGQAPIIVGKLPAPGAVPDLTQITVEFSEPVSGVDATDLLVNGVPADFIAFDGAGYTFSIFERPSPNGGTVHVSWAAAHGIQDLDANAFDHTAPDAQWDYVVSDISPPRIVTTIPAEGFVRDFTQLTIHFSEPVLNVDANDLRLNNRPAAVVTGSGDTYTFGFPNPGPNGGTVFVTWSATNRITDLSSNLFDGFNAFLRFELGDIQQPTVIDMRPNGLALPFSEVRVTFNEAVTNVDAGDLLLNGEAALSLVTSTSAPAIYIFRFKPAHVTPGQLTWAAENGITDLATNLFAGGTWNYFGRTPYSILVNPNTNTVVVTFSNRFVEFRGVHTVEGQEGRRWVPLKNFFATQNIGQVTLALPTNNHAQMRLRTLRILKNNPVPLAQAYGNIHTIAGNGGTPSGTNWASYEGIPATNYPFANPTSAMADDAGNIYVADRGAHAVLKITPDGRIRTVAGTHESGNDGDFLQATVSRLNSPTTLHVVGNDVYILDSGNSRVRVLTSAGALTFAGPAFPGIVDPVLATNLSGLWVVLDKKGNLDEVFYGAGTELKRFDPVDGVAVEGSGLLEVGSVVVNPLGRTIVADPPNNIVWRVRGGGRLEIVAGTGFPNGPTVGDADEVALPGARAIWYLPIGGYFIGMDHPGQPRNPRIGAPRVWYVDSDDIATPFIFGAPGVHAGDGEWFRAHGRAPKIGNVKSLTVAPSGDIIIVEEGAIIRKIDFLRHLP